MNLLILIAIMAIIGGIAYYLYTKEQQKNLRDYMPPLPTILKPGMFFCYFLTFDNQVAETKDHVNMIMETNWNGSELTAANMKGHGMPTILNLSAECYAPIVFTPLPDAAQRIRATLQVLKDAGVLHQVVAFYPLDEPDLHGRTDAEVSDMCKTCRAVAAEFSDIVNVKLVVIYTSSPSLPGFAEHDWIGMDDYDPGAGTLITPAWKNIMSKLNSNQRVFLVPGGGDPWKQDPEAFRRYAHITPQCIGIMPFLWAERHDDLSNPNIAGIGTNGLAEKYRAIGLEFINAK